MSKISSTFIFRKDDNLLPIWQICYDGDITYSNDDSQTITVEDYEKIISDIESTNTFLKIMKIRLENKIKKELS